MHAHSRLSCMDLHSRAIHITTKSDQCCGYMHGVQMYLNVIDQSRLHTSPPRGSEFCQQLAVGLDLLQDGSKDLLPVLANSRNGINQYCEDDLQEQATSVLHSHVAA